MNINNLWEVTLLKKRKVINLKSVNFFPPPLQLFLSLSALSPLLSELLHAHPPPPCRSGVDLCFIVEQRWVGLPLSGEGQGSGSLWMLRFSGEGDQIIRGLVDAAGRLIVKWALLSFWAASFGCLHLSLGICLKSIQMFSLLRCHKLKFHVIVYVLNTLLAHIWRSWTTNLWFLSWSWNFTQNIFLF